MKKFRFLDKNEANRCASTFDVDIFVNSTKDETGRTIPLYFVELTDKQANVWVHDEIQREKFNNRCIENRNMCIDYNNTHIDDERLTRHYIKSMFDLKDKDCDRVVIRPPFMCNNGDLVHFSDSAYFDAFCMIENSTDVYIGDNVKVGAGVIITDVQYSLSPQKGLNGVKNSKPIVIGDNVVIGSNSTILSGVHIGDNTVIEAGSVVSKDIPANVIASGNPCEVQKINDSTLQKKIDDNKGISEAFTQDYTDLEKLQFEYFTLKSTLNNKEIEQSITKKDLSDEIRDLEWKLNDIETEIAILKKKKEIKKNREMILEKERHEKARKEYAKEKRRNHIHSDIAFVPTQFSIEDFEKSRTDNVIKEYAENVSIPRTILAFDNLMEKINHARSEIDTKGTTKVHKVELQSKPKTDITTDDDKDEIIKQFLDNEEKNPAPRKHIIEVLAEEPLEQSKPIEMHKEENEIHEKFSELRNELDDTAVNEEVIKSRVQGYLNGLTDGKNEGFEDGLTVGKQKVVDTLMELLNSSARNEISKSDIINILHKVVDFD